MDCEYVESGNFKSPKISLVFNKKGHLLVRKNVRIDSLLAEKLMDISSPYVVKFIEFGEDDDGAYVIEEYVDGVTAAERSFTKKQAVKILIELCDALDALHFAKIVHRDVKPSNIIVTKDGHIKLIDFDASRIEKVVQDRDTQIIGTEGFAPPEQFGFSQTDSRSDIYSFGITMNLLLGENSGPFNKIIKKCKALDPNDRYDSISKVKTAIRLAVLRRFAAIPAAALLLIVFTTVFSVALRNRDFTDHTSVPYSESSQPPQTSEPMQTSEPLGIVSFFTTVTNSSGEYEDVCNYAFNDDSSVHGTWDVVGTLEKSQLNSFTKGRTDRLNRFIDDMLIQTVTLNADGSADVNNDSGAKWTKDYFILRYNNAQYVEKLIYAKVNGTEYLLIEDKTGSYAKTGKSDKYFVFMNSNAHKIRYTTIINDKEQYEDICDYVFYDDPNVYGAWNIIGHIGKDDYDKWISGVFDSYRSDSYWIEGITFLTNGATKMKLSNERYFDGIWTNGYAFVPNGDLQAICEYFIVTLNDTEYLLLENKNGDYTYRGKNETYFIFTRTND